MRNRPYQVGCTAAPKPNTSPGCTGTGCRCQKAKADGSVTVDDAAQPLPDLTSTFVLPEGFALAQAEMVFDPAALADPGFAPIPLAGRDADEQAIYN